MANSFSKEERTAFDDILMGFNDALTISKKVNKYGTNGELMERASDTIQRPVPYILDSQDRTVGSAVSTQDATQLEVPCVLDQKKNVTWTLNATELRDQLQEGRLGKSAYHRLASDINTKVRDVVSLEGTLVVPVTGAAGDYDDIALAEAIMLEQGMETYERCMGITARDYVGVSGNLAGRQDLAASKALTALEKSSIGMIAGFETYKLDAGKQLAANGATITTDTTGTTAGDTVKFVPAANQDNRSTNITVSATAGVAVGDAFTVAGVEAVHHITKESTGQLKTFRVTAVVDGTTLTVSPPMVGAVGTATDAETQYQNVNVASTSATAAITFLNTKATACNPFWVKDSVELMPGRYAIPDDQGVDILRGTTDQGIEVVMGKSFSNSTFVSTYTLDVFYGVTNLNPEMNGVILFNQ